MILLAIVECTNTTQHVCMSALPLSQHHTFCSRHTNSLPMLELHSIRTFVMCMTTWSLSTWRLKRSSLEGLKTHTSTSCSWSDFAVNSQLRFTLLDHRAQRALLDHYTHNLIKGIGSSHSGVLGVGVVCRLVVPISKPQLSTMSFDAY